MENLMIAKAISVSLSSDGTTLAVGASGHDSNKGTVRIYTYNGTAWTQQGSDLDGAAASDQQGRSVSLSSDGTTLAVGAFGHDSNKGTIRIYTYNGTAWNQQGGDLDGEAGNDFQGGSVSLSSDGTTLAAGFYGHDGGKGTVRIYTYNGTAWSQQGSDIDGEGASDRQGGSVSLSSDGTTLAVGAFGHDGNKGTVRIYDYNGTAWTQQGSDLDGGVDGFIETGGGYGQGQSVSLSSDGTTLAVGADRHDSNKGTVKIFTYNGTAWTQQGSDIDGVSNEDRQGQSVSLSSDGTTVAVGAYNHGGVNGNGTHTSKGTVRVYNLINTDPPTVSSITVDKTTIDENGGTAVITATISKVNSKDVTIPLTVSGIATLDSLGLNIDKDYSTIFTSKTIAQNASTVAGGNSAFGWTQNSSTALNELWRPEGIYVDENQDIYIADTWNNRVVKWVAGAIEGVVVAGGNGESLNNNALYRPTGIHVDASGNIYIADQAHHRVMKWAPDATEGTIVAGSSSGSGDATNQLNEPYDVHLDFSGNLYISDYSNNRVMKWESGATEGTVVAGGNGQGDATNQLNHPKGIDVDSSGNIYVADYYNDRVVKWAAGATEGVIVATGFTYPNDVFVDSFGDFYVSDLNNHRIQKRRWTPTYQSGNIVAGGNGNGSGANQLSSSSDIFLDKYDNGSVVSFASNLYTYISINENKNGKLLEQSHLKHSVILNMKKMKL